MCILLAHNMLSSFWISGAPRAKARACTPKCVTARRHGPSTCFSGPAFAEAASRRQAEPSEAYPTTLLQSFEGYPLRIHRPTP
jgi:hypothetical protein